MKCKDCNYCKLGHFREMPNDYVCIGVKRPFIIDNIEHECTEYPERTGKYPIKTTTSYQPKEVKAFVGDDGIYVPNSVYGSYKLLMSRELFVEAYNKYILANQFRPGFVGQDNADDWSED